MYTLINFLECLFYSLININLSSWAFEWILRVNILIYFNMSLCTRFNKHIGGIVIVKGDKQKSVDIQKYIQTCRPLSKHL